MFKSLQESLLRWVTPIRELAPDLSLGEAGVQDGPRGVLLHAVAPLVQHGEFFSEYRRVIRTPVVAAAGVALVAGAVWYFREKKVEYTIHERIPESLVPGSQIKRNITDKVLNEDVADDFSEMSKNEGITAKLKRNITDKVLNEVVADDFSEIYEDAEPFLADPRGDIVTLSDFDSDRE